jgi:hypothetical protein
MLMHKWHTTSHFPRLEPRKTGTGTPKRMIEGSRQERLHDHRRYLSFLYTLKRCLALSHRKIQFSYQLIMHVTRPSKPLQFLPYYTLCSVRCSQRFHYCSDTISPAIPMPCASHQLSTSQFIDSGQVAHHNGITRRNDPSWTMPNIKRTKLDRTWEPRCDMERALTVPTHIVTTANFCPVRLSSDSAVTICLAPVHPRG